MAKRVTDPITTRAWFCNCNNIHLHKMFLYGRNSILLVLLLAQAGSGALLNYSFTEDQDAGVPSGSKLAGAVVIFRWVRDGKPACLSCKQASMGLAEVLCACLPCRDVVRTPLQNRYLHTDIQWSNCSFAMSGVPELELKTPDGKPLVKKGEQEHHSVLPGGCSLGMVTEAGLKQVCGPLHAWAELVCGRT